MLTWKSHNTNLKTLPRNNFLGWVIRGIRYLTTAWSAETALWWFLIQASNYLLVLNVVFVYLYTHNIKAVRNELRICRWFKSSRTSTRIIGRAVERIWLVFNTLALYFAKWLKVNQYLVSCQNHLYHDPDYIVRRSWKEVFENNFSPR